MLRARRGDRARALARRGVRGWLGVVLTGCAVMLIPAVLLAAPADQDVFEDFEGFSPDTTVGVPFEIGPSGERAEFSGNAYAGEAGSLALSGTRAWMVVDAASNGRITFIDTAAEEVEFYARGAGAFGMSIRAYDTSDSQIGSTVNVNPGDGWVLVGFSGEVDHIDVINNNTSDKVSIDDFGYTVPSQVPVFGLPGLTALAIALGLGGWAAARRRGRPRGVGDA